MQPLDLTLPPSYILLRPIHQMATTWAPAVADEERQESSDAIDRKAALLAERIRESKHFLVFTGAGISTSAGEHASLNG